MPPKEKAVAEALTPLPGSSDQCAKRYRRNVEGGALRERNEPAEDGRRNPKGWRRGKDGGAFFPVQFCRFYEETGLLCIKNC